MGSAVARIVRAAVGLTALFATSAHSDDEVMKVADLKALANEAFGKAVWDESPANYLDGRELPLADLERACFLTEMTMFGPVPSAAALDAAMEGAAMKTANAKLRKKLLAPRPALAKAMSSARTFARATRDAHAPCARTLVDFLRLSGAEVGSVGDKARSGMRASLVKCFGVWSTYRPKADAHAEACSGAAKAAIAVLQESKDELSPPE